MTTAFENSETTPNVQQIQGCFGSMAVGQGAIRLEIVPTLEKSGLSPAEIAARFPAVAMLDADWAHILNDMTPMIWARRAEPCGLRRVVWAGGPLGRGDGVAATMR